MNLQGGALFWGDHHNHDNRMLNRKKRKNICNKQHNLVYMNSISIIKYMQDCCVKNFKCAIIDRED